MLVEVYDFWGFLVIEYDRIGTLSCPMKRSDKLPEKVTRGNALRQFWMMQVVSGFVLLKKKQQQGDIP